jgi:flagellar basal-body rod modification protein FlgD
MQNQDPTATTDPNEYINQLINVNSLEQLISINQTLTNDSTSSSTHAHASTPSTAASTTAATTADATNSSAVTSKDSSAASSLQSVAGNLGVPATNPSAQAVASALTRSHAKVSGVSGTN